MSENHRLRAVLEQLPADERGLFERDPALSWLASVIDQFGNLSVEDAAKAVSAEIPGLRSLYPELEPSIDVDLEDDVGDPNDPAAFVSAPIISSGDAGSTPRTRDLEAPGDPPEEE